MLALAATRAEAEAEAVRAELQQQQEEGGQGGNLEGEGVGSDNMELDGLASPLALAQRAREIEAVRMDVSRLTAAEAAAISAHRTTEQLVQLARVAYETSKSDCATPAEVATAQALVDALHLDVLQRIWARVDDDGNGVLDRLEFQFVLVLLEDVYSGSDASTRIMDYSHEDDTVSYAAAKKAATTTGAADSSGLEDGGVHACRWLEQSDQIFDVVDTDHSDSLDFGEFSRWFLREHATRLAKIGSLAFERLDVAAANTEEQRSPLGALAVVARKIEAEKYALARQLASLDERLAGKWAKLARVTSPLRVVEPDQERVVLRLPEGRRGNEAQLEELLDGFAECLGEKGPRPNLKVVFPSDPTSDEDDGEASTGQDFVESLAGWLPVTALVLDNDVVDDDEAQSKKGKQQKNKKNDHAGEAAAVGGESMPEPEPEPAVATVLLTRDSVQRGMPVRVIPRAQLRVAWEANSEVLGVWSRGAAAFAGKRGVVVRVAYEWDETVFIDCLEFSMELANEGQTSSSSEEEQEGQEGEEEEEEEAAVEDDDEDHATRSTPGSTVPLLREELLDPNGSSMEFETATMGTTNDTVDVW